MTNCILCLDTGEIEDTLGSRYCNCRRGKHMKVHCTGTLKEIEEYEKSRDSLDVKEMDKCLSGENDFHSSSEAKQRAYADDAEVSYGEYDDNKLN